LALAIERFVLSNGAKQKQPGRMRRLLSILPFVIVVLVISAGTARTLGGRQPAPPLLAMLHLTDCAPPCWIGIVPGKTTIEEARQRMNSVYSSYPGEYTLSFDGDMPRGLLWASLDDARESLGVIWITIDAQSDNVVDVIRFDFNSIYVQKLATLGEIHALLGVPSRIVLSAGAIGPMNATMAMAYGDDLQGALIFTLWNPRFHWTHQARSLILYGEGQIPLALSEDLRVWRGFTKVEWGFSR
jgi:hypothetical protein